MINIYRVWQKNKSIYFRIFFYDMILNLYPSLQFYLTCYKNYDIMDNKIRDRYYRTIFNYESIYNTFNKHRNKHINYFFKRFFNIITD